MLPDTPYYILAYYHFCEVGDPHAEVASHRAFLQGRDVTARVYLSEQGINGQLCALKSDALAYISWMEGHPLFNSVSFKVQGHHEQVFPRLTIKYRKQLVALDISVDLSQRGSYLAPEEWKKRLDSGGDYLLLDVRNEYEWRVGHFAGALSPPCETFRAFDAFARALKQQVDPSKKEVLMCCTGGIRCELFSSLLKQYGFHHVYQLEGGILAYGQKIGSAHWLGKLFVFDDRLTVPISGGSTPVVGRCHRCQEPIESYYNCANMDCNALFLSCPACLEASEGCCAAACALAPRRRPYSQQHPHKPFRRWHHYFKSKEGLNCSG